MHKSFFIFLMIAACMLVHADSIYKDDDWAASSLRQGDVLAIEVFRVEEFTRQALIEEDGTFMFPFCGYIKAAGLTPREVAKEISKRLATQVADPQVFVNVSNWAPRRVYILGQVKGSNSIELNTYSRMTALQAISMCGGFTESADLNNVVVIRRDPQTTQYQRLPVDVSALLSNGKGSDNFRLRPDDTILVPQAPPVIVSGEVHTQGLINIDTQRPPLLSELIMRAGGLSDTADPDSIYVVRTHADTSRSFIKASLRTDKPGQYKKDFPVQPGDYVLVSSAEQIYVLGQVGRPGPIVLSNNQTISAMKAITLAGGFKPSARQSDIMLIRGDERIVINLKNLYDDEDYTKRDLKLQNGDILFISESLF